MSNKINSNQNKIAVITGGAGYIGKETILRLAQRAVNIVLIDKETSNISEFIKKIENDFSITVNILDYDLSVKDTFKKVFDYVAKSYNHLDYLVNVAAFYDDIPGFNSAFNEESYEAWLSVLKVNVMAPFFLAQALAPLLLKSSHPAIVNVSSIYSIVGPDHRLYDGTSMTNPCSYSVSKAGLNQLGKWLGTVLAPHVRVNTVSPGGIERGQPKSFIDAYNSKTPLKRMCHNSEVADAIIFLLSSEASYITGHNLVVDGGWTIW